MVITSEIVIFVMTILGIAFAAWWRIEARVGKVETVLDTRVATAIAQSSMTQQQLAEYKTHVAETFVTKAGLKEFRDEVMSGVRDIKGSVGTLHERIDQMILAERKNPPSS